MHDYHAVAALVEHLTREAPDGGIHEVRIRADAVFSPEAMQQAYEMLTPRTPLEGSLLVVEELANQRECPACGVTSTVTRDDLAGHMLVCPSCGALFPIEGGSGVEVLAVTRIDRMEARA